MALKKAKDEEEATHPTQTEEPLASGKHKGKAVQEEAATASKSSSVATLEDQAPAKVKSSESSHDLRNMKVSKRWAKRPKIAFQHCMMKAESKI